MKCVPSYLHPIPDSWLQEPLPSQFTYPFRYVPHPLCRQAALAVEEKLEEMANARCQMTDERIKNEEMDNGELIKEQQMEGKMYGVMVVRDGERLYFLAAYSGQLCGSYSHPWFVPPVVDYLAPESYFQQEQAHISDLTSELEALRHDPSVAAARREVDAKLVE